MSDWAKITFKNSNWEIAQFLAKRMIRSAGGKFPTHIDGRRDDPSTTFPDQFVGLLGNMAVIQYFRGYISDFIMMRWFQDRAPFNGDAGYDIPGCNVDVKSRNMKHTNLDPTDYYLLINNQELRPGWVYILALIDVDDANKIATVWLPGWITTDRIEKFPVEMMPPFAGSRKIKIGELIPLPPINYDFWNLPEAIK